MVKREGSMDVLVLLSTHLIFFAPLRFFCVLA